MSLVNETEAGLFLILSVFLGASLINGQTVAKIADFTRESNIRLASGI